MGKFCLRSHFGVDTEVALQSEDAGLLLPAIPLIALFLSRMVFPFPAALPTPYILPIPPAALGWVPSGREMTATPEP